MIAGIDTDLLFSFAIATVVVALSFNTTYHKLNYAHRPSVAIAAAFGMITLFWLLDNPQYLHNTVSRIAIILILAVVSLANVIRRRVP
jgi:hypothetical protein